MVSLEEEDIVNLSDIVKYKVVWAESKLNIFLRLKT